MTASNKFIFRSGENEEEKDLTVRQKNNATKGCNSVVKQKILIVSKVVGLKKQARKHRSD